MPFLPPNQQCQSTEGKQLKQSVNIKHSSPWWPSSLELLQVGPGQVVKREPMVKTLISGFTGWMPFLPCNQQYERTEGQQRRQQTTKQTIFIYKDKLEKQAASQCIHTTWNISKYQNRVSC